MFLRFQILDWFSLCNMYRSEYCLMTHFQPFMITILFQYLTWKPAKQFQYSHCNIPMIYKHQMQLKEFLLISRLKVKRNNELFHITYSFCNVLELLNDFNFFSYKLCRSLMIIFHVFDSCRWEMKRKLLILS